MRRSVAGLLVFAVAACSSPSDPGGNNGGNNNGGNNNGGNNNGGGGNQSPNTINVGAGSFSPATLTVARGTAVTWESTSPGHTITPSGHTQFDRVVVNGTGDVLSVTFSTAGTYNYYCELHGSPGSGMSGRVVVQ